jgi:hypothetical protein
MLSKQEVIPWLMQRPQIKLPWSGWGWVQAPIPGHCHHPTIVKKIEHKKIGIAPITEGAANTRTN